MPWQMSNQQIEDVAKALRAHDMAGRVTLSWEAVPNSAKRKWREKATVALRAAGLQDAP